MGTNWMRSSRLCVGATGGSSIPTTLTQTHAHFTVLTQHSAPSMLTLLHAQVCISDLASFFNATEFLFIYLFIVNGNTYTIYYKVIASVFNTFFCINNTQISTLLPVECMYMYSYIYQWLPFDCCTLLLLSLLFGVFVCSLFPVQTHSLYLLQSLSFALPQFFRLSWKS